MPINHKKKGCHKNINGSEILIKDKGSRSTLTILNPTQEMPFVLHLKMDWLLMGRVGWK